jgi:predicted CxxxxCH...CXXCH cytochrome family protein
MRPEPRRLLVIVAMSAGLAAGRARAQSAVGPNIWKGVGSCSSTSCHNAGAVTGSPAVKRSEYAVWSERDPHNRAFTVLLDDRSKSIERLFRRDQPGARAESDRLCLSCHVHPDFEGARHDPGFSVEDGVSCEACHGPAQGWLVPHTAPGWKGLPPSVKSQFGMLPIEDLGIRARTCVGCHVGEGAREVNHDLIAAGHPRLNFELGAYLDILPKHWSMRDERARYPDFEARAWAVGQVATARAAVDLLARRASEPDAPWPEFTEFDCFACHHDIQKESGARKLRFDGRRPGVLPWGSWAATPLPRVADVVGPQVGGPSDALKTLRSLRQAMETPAPDRGQVATLARQSAAELTRWLDGLSAVRLDPSGLRVALDRIGRDPGPPAASWDAAAQRYFALAALHHAVRDFDPSWRDPRLEKALNFMADRLRFPDGTDSPRDFNPVEFDADLRNLGR